MKIDDKEWTKKRNRNFKGLHTHQENWVLKSETIIYKRHLTVCCVRATFFIARRPS